MQNVLSPNKLDLPIFQITNDDLENLVKCWSVKLCSKKTNSRHSCIKCLPIGDTGRIYYDAIFNE